MNNLKNNIKKKQSVQGIEMRDRKIIHYQNL